MAKSDLVERLLVLPTPLARETAKRISELEAALDEVLAAVDGCCGCVYQNEDGVYWAMRDREPLPKLNAALGDS